MIMQLRSTQKTPAPIWGESILTRYHPKFPGSSQSAGFASPSFKNCPLTLDHAVSLRQAAYFISRCSGTVPPGPSSICAPYRFPAIPALCNGQPDLLIRSSECILFSKIYPKICRPVKSAGQPLYPAAGPPAAGQDQALPDGRGGIWRSAWRPARSPSPGRALLSPPARTPSRSDRTGRSQASAAR